MEKRNINTLSDGSEKHSMEQRSFNSGTLAKSNQKKYSKGRLGFIIATSALGFALLVNGLLLGFAVSENNELSNKLENEYERSFYDMVDSVNNIEVNLSKLEASNDPAMQQGLLSEIYMESSQASQCLNALPIDHSTISDATGFVNQMGAFSFVAAENISNGNKLTDSEKEQLADMHQTALGIKYQINRLSNLINTDYRIVDNMSQQKYNFSSGFEELATTGIDYPTLIYDGPFSQSVINQKIKLGGVSVDEQTAHTKIMDTLQNIMGITELNYFDTIPEKEPKFVFTAKFENGSTGMISILQNNGFIDSIDINREFVASELTTEQCTEIATEFLADVGIADMKAVWAADFDNYVYANMVYVQDGVEIYPDMIKIKIAKDNGDVLGMEAMGYAYNHSERNIDKASISMAEAEKLLSSDLVIKNKRLVVSPKKYLGEVLTYEFECMKDGATYFIYLDAESGKEIEILKVVDANGGALLM